MKDYQYKTHHTKNRKQMRKVIDECTAQSPDLKSKKKGQPLVIKDPKRLLNQTMLEHTTRIQKTTDTLAKSHIVKEQLIG